MLPQLARPVTIGVVPGLAGLVSMAHQEDQQLAGRSRGKRERERVALAPLVVGLRVDAACERVLEVAEHEAPPVSREPVGGPRTGERSHGRAPSVGADDERRLHVTFGSVSASVAHANGSPCPPAQRLYAAALTDLDALFACRFHKLHILQVARYADSVVDSVGRRANPLAASDSLDLDMDVADSGRSQSQDPRQCPELGQLTRARGHQHMRGELIGREAHPVQYQDPPAGPSQRRRDGAAGEPGTHDDGIDPLHRQLPRPPWPVQLHAQSDRSRNASEVPTPARPGSSSSNWCGRASARRARAGSPGLSSSPSRSGQARTICGSRGSLR